MMSPQKIVVEKTRVYGQHFAVLAQSVSFVADYKSVGTNIFQPEPIMFLTDQAASFSSSQM
jgi:hypothetical protein